MPYTKFTTFNLVKGVLCGLALNSTRETHYLSVYLSSEKTPVLQVAHAAACQCLAESQIPYTESSYDVLPYVMKNNHIDCGLAH